MNNIKSLGFFKNLFVFLLVLFLSTTAFASEHVTIKNGVLDLRGVDLNEVKEVSFTGEWEFYWNELLYTSDFEQKTFSSPKLIHVPSVWTSQEVNGEKLPAKGFATYRIKVYLDEVKPMAIKFGSIGTAFNLYVDGKLTYSAGVVSKDENLAKPGYKPGVVSFTPQNETMELIFHISNYNYCKGGLWNGTSKIGLAENIYKSSKKSSNITLLIIGSMLIFALYHFGLYLLNRNFRYTLYFTIFCFILIIRTLVVNEILMLELFPNYDFNWLIKTEYFTILAGTIAFSLFIYRFFKDEFSRKLLTIILTISSIMGLFILVSPPEVFTKFLLWYQMDILFAASYIIYVVILALKNKRIGASVLLIGIIVLVFTVVNDILYSFKLINTTFMASYGFVLFLFTQGYMLAIRFSSLFVKTELLAQKLEATNENLEKIVEKRTAKIQEQNGLLLEQNNEIVAQRDSLHHQNSIVNHQKKQITDSIEYASRIQGAVLDTANEIEYVAPDNFILFHPKDIVSGDFYWFKQVRIDNKQYSIATVVDCTGHGVPGAFMSILGALFLNKIVGELKQNPEASSILNNMRWEVKNALQQNLSTKLLKDGMDMALVILDYENMKLQYAGAHNPLWIIRDNNGKPASELEEIKGDRMPIGTYVKEKETFTNHVVDVKAGDLIYLFTDGYHDQFGGDKGNKLQKRVFKEILLENAHLSLSKQKLILDKKLFEWRGNYNQIDDITVVGIRI